MPNSSPVRAAPVTGPALRQVWRGGWAIVFVLLVAISLMYWRAVGEATRQTVAQQVDYEDGTLCAKFGFAAGTTRNASCKLDLLDLRRSHEQLLGATSVP